MTPVGYLRKIAEEWQQKVAMYDKTYQHEKREYACGFADAIAEIAMLSERQGWTSTMPGGTHTNEGSDPGYRVLIFKDSTLVASAHTMLLPLAEQYANAALIAAAPELAEALRELHDYAVSYPRYRHGDRSVRAFENAGKLLERVGY